MSERKAGASWTVHACVALLFAMVWCSSALANGAGGHVTGWAVGQDYGAHERSHHAEFSDSLDRADAAAASRADAVAPAGEPYFGSYGTNDGSGQTAQATLVSDVRAASAWVGRLGPMIALWGLGLALALSRRRRRPLRQPQLRVRATVLSLTD